MPLRAACLHHCTSLPYRFFGRTAELALLDRALHDDAVSVAAFVGPGGQGKTAIVQQWLERGAASPTRPDGVFLWSFYRGKDADLCLRELYAYATCQARSAEVSASYCVDHLVPLLRRERWALVLDGAEVVQYDRGPWFGRFLHPELGRLVEELAGAPSPGVVVLTTRFPLPCLDKRRHARVLTLGSLDPASARGLLETFGVRGSPAELEEVAASCGFHAKAVELLGTYLVHFRQGEAVRQRELPPPAAAAGANEEEQKVARVLSAYQAALPAEAKDIIALATAFREPPAVSRLLEYLPSAPVRSLLHGTWGRQYVPFAERPAGWLAEQVQELVALRLLERVSGPQRTGHQGHHQPEAQARDIYPPSLALRAGVQECAGEVIDAHPLVRRAFEHYLGPAGQRQSAQARAGFLRGRPDRRRPASLEEAREEVELFHAHCDAGLWNEADGTFVALDNPKHRFLAPAFERDLLLRFFPQGDWRRQPLWPGFGRYRSLAICCELLGHFEDALAAYPEPDAPLRGDALLALGRIEPLLAVKQAPPPWQALWGAYRAHALCLAGRTAEGVALARSLVPVDVYEWVHVFECLLRAGELAAVDLRSLLYRPPHTTEHRWAELARRRMRADYQRLGNSPPAGLGSEYVEILKAYDRGGMPYERALTRLSYATWLAAREELAEAREINETALDLARRQLMRVVEADAWRLAAGIARRGGRTDQAKAAEEEVSRLRREAGYHGPARP
jgi:hypothetical protein